MERWQKYNPATDASSRMMAIIYAQTGRIEEAREMLEQGTQGWPADMRTVNFMMSFWPFKRIDALEGFAQGYLKAGLPVDLPGYYDLSKENRLDGEEIKELFFGHNIAGVVPGSGKQWWIDRDVAGNARIQDGDKTDNGKSWIEEEMLCNQWENLYEGLRDCWVVYHNPDGTPEKLNQYVGAPGFGLLPFSGISPDHRN